MDQPMMMIEKKESSLIPSRLNFAALPPKQLAAACAFLIAAAIVLTMPRPCAAQSPRPINVRLPSRYSTGSPVVDTILLYYHPAAVHPDIAVNGLSPAVILIGSIGDNEHDPLMDRLARSIAARGIACVTLDLPYHGGRRPSDKAKDGANDHFTSADASVDAAAVAQSASDVQTTLTWLAQQPGVDPNRLGFVGVSLGAIIGHLAMGLDSRLKAGVLMLGGGDLTDFAKHGVSIQAMRLLHPYRNSPADWAALEQVDPLKYASRNLPRHILMIQGARDFVVPPRDSEELWRALGKPEIQWVDVNHLGLELNPSSAINTATAYLASTWSSDPAVRDAPTPQVVAPTIKLGLLFIHDSHVYPTLLYEALRFGHRRDHMPLADLNVGLSTSRPLATLGVTVSPYIDVGYAERLGDRTPQPYVSLHLVF